MPRVSPNQPRMIRARQLEVRALELRKRGLSFAKIASELGVTEEGARRAVVRGLQRLTNESEDLARHYRSLDLARLDDMWNAIAPKLDRGDLRAIDRALRIIQQRARMLGYEAPIQVEHRGAVEIVVDLSTEGSS